MPCGAVAKVSPLALFSVGCSAVQVSHSIWPGCRIGKVAGHVDGSGCDSDSGEDDEPKELCPVGRRILGIYNEVNLLASLVLCHDLE